MFDGCDNGTGYNAGWISGGFVHLPSPFVHDDDDPYPSAHDDDDDSESSYHDDDDCEPY